MKLRIAKRIKKNAAKAEGTLKHHKYQIDKAETVLRRYQKNKKD